MPSFKRYIEVAIVTSVVLGLMYGCGKSDDKKPSTQVAARVNGSEITVHQVNFALSQAGAIPPEQMGRAQKQVLDKLVDQQVLMQKAVEKKLDRNPNVVQAIAAAKNQILAQAYLEQLVAGLPPITPQELDAFFTQHPEMFKNRRIFRLQQIAVMASESLRPKLSDRIHKAKTLNDIALWLDGEHIPFKAGEPSTLAVEQLPLEWVPVLQKMKDGGITVLPQQNLWLITQIEASRAAPLDEQQAKPLIERFLQNQKRIALVKSELSRLKPQGSVQYIGTFAQAGTPDKANQTATAPSAAAPQNDVKTTHGEKSFIDKGVAGLR